MNSFDLRAPWAEVACNSRVLRIEFGIFAVVSVLLFGWFVSLALTPSDFHDTLQKVTVMAVLAGTGFMAGFMIYAAWSIGPGATSIAIDSNGIAFGWGNRRAEQLEWHRLTAGFVLLDYSANAILTGATRFQWELRRWNRPPTRLTKEAFDAIIHEASQHGLQVQSTDHPSSFLGWSQCRVLRFAPATSGRAG